MSTAELRDEVTQGEVPGHVPAGFVHSIASLTSLTLMSFFKRSRVRARGQSVWFRVDPGWAAPRSLAAMASRVSAFGTLLQQPLGLDQKQP